MTGPRAKPTPMRQALIDAREAARHAAAETLFDDTKVKAALMASADRGLNACAFRSEIPLDLRGTTAAIRVEAWAKSQGLKARWEPVVAVLDQGIEVGQTRCLVIEWGTLPDSQD